MTGAIKVNDIAIQQCEAPPVGKHHSSGQLHNASWMNSNRLKECLAVIDSNDGLARRHTRSIVKMLTAKDHIKDDLKNIVRGALKPP